MLPQCSKAQLVLGRLEFLLCLAIMGLSETLTGCAAITSQSNPGTSSSPTVTITAPSAGATVSGTITVSANATVSVGVANVAFQDLGRHLEGVLAV